jgi:ferredoxin-NADP reductase
METFEARLLKVISNNHCSECLVVKTFRFENPVDLEYKAGQFFIIDIMVDEKQHRHHFSFSSSPTEKGYLEFTTRIRDSDFKNALLKLREGDLARFKAPFGKFILEENLEKIGMLSGGIGIAPLKSICKYCTDKELPVDIVLLFGNHKEEDILFQDEFLAMQKANPNLRLEYTVLEPSESWNAFYVCGPPPMTAAMDEVLTEMNLARERIRKESFAGYQEMFP